MRHVGLLLIIVVFSACGPATEDSIPAYEFEQYSLFTWKTRRDDFFFAIMIQAESHKFLRSGTATGNAKRGVSELKEALTALPKGSHVLWQDWPPGNFDYPRDDVVQEVIDFAKSKGVLVEQSPALR